MRSLGRISVITGALLVGCSAEPDQGQLEKAVKAKVQAEMESAQARLKALGDNPFTKDLVKGFEVDLTTLSITKLGCTKAEPNPGYNCDVEVRNSREPKKKAAMKGRFVKTDDGWRMMEEARQ